MSEVIEIYLNSKSADKYYNNMISDAMFSLPNIVIGKNEKAYVSVKNCVIPRSFYNVNDTNSILNYSIDSIDYTRTLTKGNYNVITLKTHLTELFNILGHTIVITYNTKTNTFLFTSTSGEFTFKSTSNCFELLGFLDNDDYSSTNYILESRIGVNLFTVKNIYVTSDNFILNNIDSNNHNKSNIICSIPVKGVANSILFYEDNTKHLVHNVENLTTLRIMLTDENSNMIDFNNIHYSITLEITITK
jgi:hypothetical protein